MFDENTEPLPSLKKEGALDDLEISLLKPSPKNPLTVDCSKKRKLAVELHGIFKSADSVEIFSSFKRSLRSLCLSMRQIDAFIKDHQDSLSPNGFSTLFILRRGKEFFVVDVHFNMKFGKIQKHISPLSVRNSYYYIGVIVHRVVVLARE